MSRVELRVIEGQPVKIGDRLVTLGETAAVDVGKSTSVAEAPNEEPVALNAPGADVFDPGNRPNGLMTAGIAPKLPKAAGELEQVPIGDGRVAERQVEGDAGKATQGGGPRSGDTLTTPGPQPDNTGMTGDRTATAQSGPSTSNRGVEASRPKAQTREGRRQKAAPTKGSKGSRKATRR